MMQRSKTSSTRSSTVTPTMLFGTRLSTVRQI
jgi:hypothetical protein